MMEASTASQESGSTNVQQESNPSWVSEVVEILAQEEFDIKDESSSGADTPQVRDIEFVSVWLTEGSLDKLRETIGKADVSDDLVVVGPDATQSLPQYRDSTGSGSGRGLAVVTKRQGPRVSSQERAQKRALQF